MKNRKFIDNATLYATAGCGGNGSAYVARAQSRDAALIAAMRNALPALLDFVDTACHWPHVERGPLDGCGCESCESIKKLTAALAKTGGSHE